MTFRDTIAAIATPPGVGGVGLIRISGPSAEEIARRIFRPFRPLRRFRSHQLYHGEIVAPATGAVLDEVLAAFMKGPHTYTGEDTFEISCHGGPLLLRTVLEEILCAGARPAERGEFTKRAFLNDRIDLSQAEAVLDIIHAQTREGLCAAAARLQGHLSGRIEAIRDAIIDLLSAVEAAIDFAEEDGGEETPRGNTSRLQSVIDDLRALAATYRRGRIYREGVSVVIAGRPNVGKSSLLNRFLGEKRAIVTSIPGTTRDFIEEAISIGGVPVRLTDTAGIRPPENAIEEEGIALVWERLAAADAILVVLDGSMALTPEDYDLLTKMPEKPVLCVVNKSDIPQRLSGTELKELLREAAPLPIPVSAKYGDGIERLAAGLREMIIASPAEEAPEAMIADLRQRRALDTAAECLTRVTDGLSPELAALEMREALNTLGEITGRTTAEEVLDRIFANFCIGK